VLIKGADDVVRNKSQYQVELEQMAEASESISDLEKKNKVAWLAADEAGGGTNPISGAYAIGKLTKEQLVPKKSLLFAMATQHQQAVVDIEKETKGACLNYNVDVKIDPSGEIKRDYLLKRGISTVNLGPLLYDQAFGKKAEKKHTPEIF